MNPLAKAVRDYLVLRRGLGFKLVRHEAGLQEFASFLARKRSSHITVALALEATRHAHQKPAEWAARPALCAALPAWSATDSSTEVPRWSVALSSGTRSTIFIPTRNPAVAGSRQGSTIH
jgi:hypothetical protein